MKLDFLIIGAAKCATSSIGELIRSHPDVHLIHERDEGAFFAFDEVFARGYAWYASLFEQARPGTHLAASNNYYTMRELHPEAARRIYEYQPDTKLIYSVRDPLPRLASHWLQSVPGGHVHYDFDTAIRTNRQFLVDSTNYWKQLGPYRSLFGDDRIHVVFFEDFKRDPEQTIRECYRFLGLDDQVDVDSSGRWLNPTRGKKITPRWQHRLRESSSIYRSLSKRMPESMKSWLRQKLISRTATGLPVLSEMNRAWVLEQLREDSLRLIEYCGKPGDFWSLEQE